MPFRRIGACWRTAKPNTWAILLGLGQKPNLGAKKMGRAAVEVRILVVDDHEAFRVVVRSILEARPELQVVGEASDGLAAVQKAKELQPDLICLDIGMPTLNGIEAAHRILRFVPGAKILFISQDSDAEVIAEAFNNGAKGYVFKLDAVRELLLAVESVLRGQSFVSAGITLRAPLPSH
jgi:DNA-binding NarL/FixJ family response regulator